jgi:polyvinyl alcohol dehydrogenase (cytochrome)
VLFKDDTYRTYSKTLSGEQGRGGSISNSTVVAADDMVFVQSGYAHYGGSPGNMLIAYRLGKESEK